MGSRYSDAVSGLREQLRQDVRAVTEFAKEARVAARVRGRGIGRVADGARRDVTAEARALADDLADLADAALRSRTDNRKSKLSNLFGSRTRTRR